jgi:hypothetical protein
MRIFREVCANSAVTVRSNKIHMLDMFQPSFQ